jgi:protease-4
MKKLIKRKCVAVFYRQKRGNRMSASPKSGPWTKSPSESDPRITPWSDEEYAETVNQPPRKRGRTLRDWMVIGLAFLLVFYVTLFLITAFTPDAGAPSSTGSGFSFLSGGEVAVIPIQGEISSSTSNDSIGYRDVVQALDDAENDPSIRVILLDIDSGGGSVVSSKQIVSKLRDVNKPVVSWIGEVGASGAYYIASASDYVMADADSITGSIGVISMQPNVEELMQKLGVKMNTVKTGELKDMGSPFNEMSEKDREVLQSIVSEAFESFKSDVQSFRGEKLNSEKFSEVLDGRILSGRQALSIGLIDETGTWEDAQRKTSEIMGLPGSMPPLRYYLEKKPTLWDVFFSAGASFGKGISSEINPLAESDSAKIEAK